MYIADYVDKTADRWRPDTGADGSPSCVFIGDINVGDESLAGLLKKLADRYGYDGKYWFLTDDCSGVSFNQTEDAEGNQLTDSQCQEFWRLGKEVFICDYFFSIEYHEIRSVSESEFMAAFTEIGATHG